jgi:hypothetical protein
LPVEPSCSVSLRIQELVTGEQTVDTTVRWSGHIARIDEPSNAYKIVVRIPQGKRLQKHLHINRRTILKWIMKKWNRRVRTGFVCLKIGTSGGPL